MARNWEDDKFFVCAVAGRADIIAAGDTHVQGAKQHQRIRVLSPAAVVALLGGARP